MQNEHCENVQQEFTYRGKWIKNWFSNMEPFDEPFIWDGVTYQTPENVYQAAKTLDQAARAKIARMSPLAAKQAGKRVNLQPDWTEVRESCMEMALRHKFKTGTSWHEKLMKTGNCEFRKLWRLDQRKDPEIMAALL